MSITRTIADLEGVKNITTNHIAEALQYRPKEVNFNSTPLFLEEFCRLTPNQLPHKIS